jgi:hypothetical protein
MVISLWLYMKSDVKYEVLNADIMLEVQIQKVSIIDNSVSLSLDTLY